MDLFDPRADFRYDMNRPVPQNEHERFHAVIDIGSIEHVFDTRQGIENCLRMVRPQGFYFLHTCVSGYYRHGLHVLNPEALILSLKLNGFEVVYHRYSTERGIPLASPLPYDDVVIWLVGRKMKSLRTFAIPQQESWKDLYANH